MLIGHGSYLLSSRAKADGYISENKAIPHHPAYNRANYLAERVQFMQWHSDYLKQHDDQATQQIQAA